jgi:PASTA domain/Glucodextranase, domain B
VRRLLLLPLVLACALSGCGGDDRPAAPLRAVQLSLSNPADAGTVEGDAVEVTGRVVPSASTVQVLGRDVDVSAGSFTTEVALEEGANLIDVTASAPGRRPVSTALRVVREVPVEIPDLRGDDPEEAVQTLEGLGLEAETRRGGGLLDDLLPGEIAVCATDPEDGTRVRPGTTVTLEVAKVC